MYRDIPSELRESIEPVVADYGFELVNVDIQRGGNPVMKVTIDTPAGDGRVPVEALERVSRELGTQLDAVDAMPGAYRLEVSSPGLDRLLGREKDFVAACAAGREVKITTRGPLEGRRRFRGKLVDFRRRNAGADDQGDASAAGDEARDAVACVEDSGNRYEIPFSQIDRANAIYEFSSADFRDENESGR